MKNLVKVAIIAIALSTSFAANAQQGQMAAGANLFIGGSNETFFGLGVKFQYNVTDPIRLEGSFLWFFPKTETVPGFPPLIPSQDVSRNIWDLSVNAHYLFPISGTQLTIYPLAGLGWFGARSSIGGTNIGASRFGFNLGGGVDFPITETIILNFEARYKLVSNWDNPYFIGIGAAFRF
ncbi:MAG: porin family protein [Bacteroidales bacterium]|nr:porin family protein [Bacteroidales bacterium]